MRTVELLRVGAGQIVTSALLDELLQTPLPLPVLDRADCPPMAKRLGDVVALTRDGDRLMAETTANPTLPLVPTVMFGAVDPDSGAPLGARLVNIFATPEPLPGAGGTSL